MVSLWKKKGKVEGKKDKIEINEEYPEPNTISANIMKGNKSEDGIFTKKNLSKRSDFQINVGREITPYTTRVDFGDYSFFFDEQGKDMGLVQENRGSQSKIYRNCRNPQTKGVVPYDYHRLTKEVFERNYAPLVQALEIKLGRKIIDGKKLQSTSDNKSRVQLEGKLGVIAILSIVVGIFFLSPNLTGNAISNLTNQTSNIIGGGLFLIGIIGGLMWFKNR